MKRKTKTLLDNFRGELVIVYISSLNMTEQDNEGNITTGNLIARGYFLSHDKENYYLGNEMGDLVEVINKQHVARISLDDAEETIMDDSVPDNGDRGKWN